MDNSRFEPITSKGTRSRSPRPRSRSHSRSFRERPSRPATLRHVYSARAFDDHAVYSRHNSLPSPSAEDQTDGTSTSSDELVEKNGDVDLEKQETEELREPEMEWDDGVVAERDFGEKPGPPLSRSETQKAKEKDPNLVMWDGPDDPTNPKNWSMGRKWAATFVVSSFTFISPVSSSMVAPALTAVSKDLHITQEVESAMILSIFVLAYAIGPLFLGPLSEVYGRKKVVQYSNLFYLVWNLACGFAQTSGQMLAFRFLAGIGGSALLAIGGGILGDCWSADQRGKAISIYSLAPLLGPAVGPIAGGFIALRTTWRWVFWSTTILTVFIQISGIFFLQETYAPTILGKKAAALRKETGNEKLHTEYDHPDRTLRRVLGTALIRPFRMIATQPIIQVIGLYMAYLYGLMYLLLSTFPTLWTGQYGENVGIGGLNYISLGTGFFLGTQITAPLNDRIYKRLKKQNNGIGKPEFRVPAMFVGSTFIPIGLFWYGWSAQAKLHWIMPNIGAAIFAAGSIVCFQCMQTYIVDSYTRYAASGTAAAVLLRSLAGFGFPLFAPYMYGKLGYGWGNSLLGFVAIGMGIPAPFLFWFYGERLRGKSTYAAGG
ncbi:MFS general substrate transporter [Tothia fuscella]|uniref:MFS general substrate transporter n=1 Tax=Tothia fuscella TaxID=1048955 RepID=A0A9P4TZ41_9PEZI|nr:MFS general substrate transporter [Tothia fuscella]